MASGSSAETRPFPTGSPCPRTRIGGPDMQTYGMALDLRDDPLLIARYKKEHAEVWPEVVARLRDIGVTEMKIFLDRKSTRLNSSHLVISYAVFCLKKKNITSYDAP